MRHGVGIVQSVICDAIRGRRLLIFGYGDQVRVAEPHAYSRNRVDHDVLSAWLRPGYSRSDPDGGWRTFLVAATRAVQMLPEEFSGPRAGFNPRDGRLLEIYCQLATAEASAVASPG
jgi:hypothetical protein